MKSIFAFGLLLLTPFGIWAQNSVLEVNITDEIEFLQSRLILSEEQVLALKPVIAEQVQTMLPHLEELQKTTTRRERMSIARTIRPLMQAIESKILVILDEDQGKSFLALQKERQQARRKNFQ